jgi:Ni2+-binding GTPase involved in maturation of urease and hydrogenase
MMKLVVAVAAVLMVASCGAAGGGKAALVKSCVKGGETKKTCDCVATELQKNADKDVFRAMVLQSEGKDAEAEKIMNALPMEKQFSAASAAMGAMMKCAVGPQSN